ncbi:MAG: hypothetical protein ACRBN8_23315 [Nannocystales bacterium]
MSRVGLTLSLIIGSAACGDDVGTASGDATGSTTAIGSTSTGPSSTTAADGTGSGESGSPATSTSAPSTTGTTNGTTGASNDSGSDTSGTTGGPVLPECDYPISWEADAGAQAAAQAELDLIAPEATMTWNADRGTFSAVSDLDVVLDCPDDEPLLDAVFAYFELHPDLFPIAADEWFTGGGNLCQHVTSPTPNTFNTSRRDMSVWTVSRDVIAPRLYRSETGDVVLRSVSGTFVPTLPEDIEQQVSDCIAKGPNQSLLEDTLREEPFDYLIYGGPVFCGPAGTGMYVAQNADSVVFSSSAQLSWSDVGDGSTSVTIAQRVELVLDASSVTVTLEASNAACPDPDGAGTIYGFAAFMDLVTAEISNKLAGLGCIVC